MNWEEVEERWFESDLDGVNDDTSSAFWQAAKNISETEATDAHRNQVRSFEDPKKVAKETLLFGRLIDRFCSITHIKGAKL
jgi:hypothetical protein